MPSLSTLRDDFSDNTESPAWAGGGTSGSATKSETTGQARFTLPSNTAGTHIAYYGTPASYDLTGDSFYINIGTMVSTSVAATAWFRLVLDSNNYLEWRQLSGTVEARKIVAGVATSLFSAAWSSSTYKYLRISESGGTLTFASSSNGTSWTTRDTEAAPFAVTALKVQFGAECGNVASPGSFRLDDVNLILPALSTTWRYTEAERPYITRIGSVTISATSGQGYLSTAEELDASGNLVSPRYFSGPIGSTSGGYLQLTEYTAQADAQAMAVNLPADGRWDLPGYVSASVVRLYHRSITGSSYRVDEFYPRRLVQSDDIEAESITALNIAANTITADKITTLTLTGKNIQTATSGARVVLSGDAAGGLIGYGASDTYDTVAGTGTYQLLWSKADGKLYFGGGNGLLDGNGLRLNAPTSGTYDATRSVTWYNASSVAIASLMSSFQSGLNVLELRSKYAASQSGHMYLLADSATGQAYGYFGHRGLGSVAELGANAIAAKVTDTTYGFTLYATQTDIDNYTNPIFRVLPTGNVTAAAITGLVFDATTNSAATVLTLGHNSSGTPTTFFGTRIEFQAQSSTTLDQVTGRIYSRWAAATHASRRGETLITAVDAASERVGVTVGTDGSAAKVGFYGSQGAVKPTVTGSRGGNAALASLLTQLASLGLITDSSS